MLTKPGSFTDIGGATRNGLAALDAGTGAATAWNPVQQGEVEVSTLGLEGKVLYVGGSLSGDIGGRQARGLAALDTGTGVALDWNPDIDGLVSYTQTLSGRPATPSAV